MSDRIPGPARLAGELAKWLLEDTTAYVAQRGNSDSRLYVEGTLDLDDLARWILERFDDAPCDCGPDRRTVRITSGTGDLSGPYRSIWSCEEHRVLSAAWCQRGTGIAPTYTEQSQRAGGFTSLTADPLKENP